MADIPVLDNDSSAAAVLRESDRFDERLREAGPVVRLSKYDVFASGRYAEVHAALIDW